jgi:hypothetical protein
MAERQSSIVGIRCQIGQSRPSADVAHSLEFVDILELKRKFSADISVNFAHPRAF